MFCNISIPVDPNPPPPPSPPSSSHFLNLIRCLFYFNGFFLCFSLRVGQNGSFPNSTTRNWRWWSSSLLFNFMVPFQGFFFFSSFTPLQTAVCRFSNLFQETNSKIYIYSPRKLLVHPHGERQIEARFVRWKWTRTKLLWVVLLAPTGRDRECGLRIL